MKSRNSVHDVTTDLDVLTALAEMSCTSPVAGVNRTDIGLARCPIHGGGDPGSTNAGRGELLVPFLL